MAAKREAPGLHGAVDFGTEWRRRHGRVVVEGWDGQALDEAGDRVVRARDQQERVIDALLLDGLLWTRGEDAGDGDRRYSAARKLFGIYAACRFPAPRAASYGERSGAGGIAGLTDEEAEELADARAAYRVAMGIMGLTAETVRNVVCLDQAYMRHSPRLSRMVWLMWRLDALRGGLDALATLWGMR